MKPWYIYSKKADFTGIAKQFNISPLFARILVNRGIERPEDIKAFLYDGLESCSDPFLFAGMDGASSLCADSIKANKKIYISGDYDVDGVCAAYILERFLKDAGAQVCAILPEREKDGYGLSCRMVDIAKDAGAKLIITCDNGISANESVSYAKSLGLDVIVTDHHEPPQNLPDANFIIDAKQPGDTYPFKELCGASVAYKFALAVNSKLINPVSPGLFDELLQYAGFATVCDVVPLTGENRVIAREGISRLKKTQSCGLNALIAATGTKKESIRANTLGFILGPCINSAGRLKSASIALDLLKETYPDKAMELAKTLVGLNNERKELTSIYAEKARKSAVDIIEKAPETGVLVIYVPDAHESIAGIIAGRIKDEFNRPTLVITDSKQGLKGSARSTENYDIHLNLEKNSQLFYRFGGHKSAAGFTLKCTPDELSNALNKGGFGAEAAGEKTWIDFKLPFEYISEDFLDELKLLEPVGCAVSAPLFAQNNLLVQSSNPVYSENGSYLSLRVKSETGFSISGRMYAGEEKVREVSDVINQLESDYGEAYVMMTFMPGISSFRGMKNPYLKIKEIKPSKHV